MNKLSVLGAIQILSARFTAGNTLSGYALENLIAKELYKANGQCLSTDRNMFRRVRESGMWRGLSRNNTKNTLHRVSFYERTGE